MKVLFLYNPVSGHHKIKRYLSYIKKIFNNSFGDYTVIESISPEHFKNVIISHSATCDLLVIGGGDGTINMAINTLETCETKPVLGIIPTGTINDSARNIGCKTSIKKAVKNLVKINTQKVDILKINNTFALYTLACGAFSDIPYVTRNFPKRIFGRFAYYFLAIPRLFKKIRVTGFVELSNKEVINFKTPFVLFLNGKRMGGFTINKQSIIDDGLAELYLAKPSFLNSIPKYFFNRKQIPCYKDFKFHIHINENMSWTIDGEKCFGTDLDVEILQNHLTIAK